MDTSDMSWRHGGVASGTVVDRGASATRHTIA